MSWLSWIGVGLLQFGWLSTLIKLLRGTDRPPQWTLDPGMTPEPVPAGTSLSIVVPARNEARNIEKCVRAALAVDWPGRLQVVVVDDRSTDGTGEILARLQREDSSARAVAQSEHAKDPASAAERRGTPPDSLPFSAAEARLVVVGGADPPAGWLGKPHALHLAQQHATGDWLMFVDADVTLEPAGPRLLIGRTIAQDAVMASGLGALEVETFWERVIQTRIGAVIAGGNPLEKVNDPEDKAALANGQCLLFKRTAYDQLGGHEAIKGSVLDDVDFAKKAKADKVPYRLYFSPGVFRCRMYTGFQEIWNGWTKNLFPALSYSFIATFIVVALLFASALLPFVLVAKNLAAGAPYPGYFWLECSLLVTIFLVDAIGHKVNGYKWGLFWTFPLGMVMVLGLFLNSAWRIGSGRGAVWKGRVVEAGGRKKG